MEFKRTENLNVDLTESIQNFTNLVHKHATTISLQKEGMEIEARHVRRKQLNVYLEKEILNRKPPTDSSSSGARKRHSTDAQLNPMKRQKGNDSVSNPKRKLIKIWSSFKRHSFGKIYFI